MLKDCPHQHLKEIICFFGLQVATGKTKKVVLFCSLPREELTVTSSSSVFVVVFYSFISNLQFTLQNDSVSSFVGLNPGFPPLAYFSHKYLYATLAVDCLQDCPTWIS